MSGYKKEQIQTYTEILLGSFRRKKLKVEEGEDHVLKVQEIGKRDLILEEGVKGRVHSNLKLVSKVVF